MDQIEKQIKNGVTYHLALILSPAAVAATAETLGGRESSVSRQARRPCGQAEDRGMAAARGTRSLEI
jgi:hypothetical protein